MKTTIAIASLAVLLSQACVSASNAFPDAVLLDAMEKGGSLVSVQILLVRKVEEKGTSLWFYRGQIMKLIAAGDLSPADIQSPVDLFAGASYGKALTIGTNYMLFVTKSAPHFFSWVQRDHVIEMGPESRWSLKQVEEQALRLYMESPLHKFREGQTKAGGPLPPIPESLKATCAEFRDLKSERCELARTIWKSSIASPRDESRPWVSFISYFTPKIQLSRAQVLQLLGEPTVKLGYTYKWFCGRDTRGRAGVLRAVFESEDLLRTLVYSAEPLNHWREKEKDPMRP